MEQYLHDPEVAAMKDSKIKDLLHIDELCHKHEEDALLNLADSQVPPSIEELQAKAQEYILQVNRGKMDKRSANRAIRQMYSNAKRYKPERKLTLEEKH